jgi:hypothetical protein
MARGDKGTSAGGRHGSHDTRDNPGDGTNANKTGDHQNRDKAATAAHSGLQEHTGEFRVGEKIIFGMRNGDILIRRSPQGEEVTVSEATLAGLMIDAFFSDKFKGDYPTVTRQ